MDASVNRIPISDNEKAMLAGILLSGDKESDVVHSLEELSQLVGTAGAVVTSKHVIKRHAIDPAYIIGTGKLEELKSIVRENSIKLVVFDLNNIRPVQIRNLENALECRVLGRTEVILDIFARRAKTVEAKIQVELAQLNYILPRLKGLGGVLSRLGGGIGTRGPGEKMLETDRRHILRRITTLKKKLSQISRHRNVQRKERLYNEIIGSVAGYTNTGKSTLVNLLAKDDLFVEDRLFATLDAYTRTVYLNSSNKVLLTDTIGFINNLPSHLIESFTSTLEEIKYADFIIHVVGLDMDVDKAIAVVNHELKMLDCQEKPVILYFNKLDIAPLETVHYVQLRYPDAIVGSNITGEGIQQLKERITYITERIKTSKHHPRTISESGHHLNTLIQIKADAD